MGNIREYKRSKKLYASGEDWTFVKPRHWCEEIEIDGLILRKGEPLKQRGEIVSYNYYIEDYGGYDPSVPDSEVYDWDTPPVNADGYVSERNWPQEISLSDGTILRKTWEGKKPHRYATYYVETWGEADPSLPEAECYEGEFDKEN